MTDTTLFFRLLNEVGIINQLATTLFNRRLPGRVHVAHFAVLNHMIRLGEGKTPLELASAFQVAKGTMTHTLGELTRRGFIEIAPNDLDKRSKRVFLTAAGRAFHKDAIETLEPLATLLGAEIGQDRANAILPILEDIRKLLDANRTL